MNGDQVGRLEGLLERIRRNAAKPRALQPTATLHGPTANRAAEPLQAAPTPAPSEDDMSSISAPVELSGIPAAPQFAPESFAEPVHIEPPSSIPEVAPIPTSAEHADGAHDVELENDEDGAPVLELAEEEIVEIDVDDVEEILSDPPPSSSRRPKLAPSSMDEALAGVAEQLDDEREVPLKTPPPESGRQVAAAPIGDFRRSEPPADLLEADISGEGFSEVESPTAAQLGQTLDLREEPGPALELGDPFPVEQPQPERHPEPQPEAEPDDLEAAIPSARSAIAFGGDLPPPSQAREQLERHREMERPASSQPEPLTAVEEAGASPSVVARSPVISSAPVAIVFGREQARVATFMELLDDALSLGQS